MRQTSMCMYMLHAFCGLHSGAGCTTLRFSFVDLYVARSRQYHPSGRVQRKEATKSASRLDTLRLKYSTSFQQSSGRSWFFLPTLVSKTSNREYEDPGLTGNIERRHPSAS